MNYQSNTTLKQIADRLRGAAKVLITTHAKPDGDAMGAIVALGEALKQSGKQVEMRAMGPIARNLSVLTGRTRIVEHQPQLQIDEPDTIVVLDTGAWSQLDAMRDWLSAPGRREKTIVIDHHQRGDDVGAMLLVEPKAAAACELVAELIDELGAQRTPLIVDALFVGIATDTGWFRFSNTAAKTHALAATLVRDGADTAALYAATEQCDRPNKLALLQRAMNSLQLVAAERAVVMTLAETDFQQTGARIDETERFVDVPQFVGQVQVVALIVEENHRTRLSLRSKAGAGAMDVNELAGVFGGGGHQRAAGAKIEQPVEQVKQRLIAEIENRMTGADA